MRTITNKGGNTDLRALLLKAGVGDTNASMGIQFMNFLPTTTDPYAPGTIEIVKGLQRLLVQRGARIEVDGGLGENTVKAILPYAGPRWHDKSWSQIYGDVIDGRLWQSWDRESRGQQKNALDYYRRNVKPGERPRYTAVGMTRFSSDHSKDGFAGFQEELGHTAYSHLGDEGLLPMNYCSPGHNVTITPGVAGCGPIAGVAKPLDAMTLTIFTQLQRVINAHLQGKGKPLISVDGRIGPQTIAALNYLASSAGGSNVLITTMTGGTVNVESIALHAGNVLNALEGLRLGANLPIPANPPTTSPPSTIGANNTVINPSNSAISASLGGLDKLLPFAAVGVGLLLVLKLTSGKRSRSSGKRR
jgi:hypothetical protein